MHRSYILVEGPHDVEFLARLLPKDVHRVRDFAALDPSWQPLVPRSYPHKGDLLARVPLPTFFAGPALSIALHSAAGIDKLVKTLEESTAIFDTYKVALDSVAVVLDADDHVPPVQRHAALRQRLRTLPRPANWPVVGGEVAPGPPRCGIFVLPDNEQPGSLEDLLLEASHQSYPGLHQRSEAFIATIDGDIGALGLIPRDLKDLRKPSGARKATLACVANVLRPGKAIQVAIQDGRWLDAAAIAALPRIQSVQAFVQTLLGLGSTAAPGGLSPGSELAGLLADLAGGEQPGERGA